MTKNIEWINHPITSDICGKIDQNEIFTIKTIKYKGGESFNLISWSFKNTFLPTSYSSKELGSYDTVEKAKSKAESLWVEFNEMILSPTLV